MHNHSETSPLSSLSQAFTHLERASPDGDVLERGVRVNIQDLLIDERLKGCEAKRLLRFHVMVGCLAFDWFGVWTHGYRHAIMLRQEEIFQPRAAGSSKLC